MTKEIEKMLDAQINKEFHSAYLYLGIANYFAGKNLNGFASWYKVQAAEEQEHAMKIYDYMVENGCQVSLPALEAVTVSYDSPLAAVEAADKHEHYITDEITKIYHAAVEAKDYRVQLFLNWFIQEQEEEEQNSADMVAKVKVMGDSDKHLYILDKEVGGRQG
ncbi:MAG: ferritin [Eubacterium sp.]|nr:ferritin [Eubacterium sp.]